MATSTKKTKILSADDFSGDFGKFFMDGATLNVYEVVKDDGTEYWTDEVILKDGKVFLEPCLP